MKNINIETIKNKNYLINLIGFSDNFLQDVAKNVSINYSVLTITGKDNFKKTDILNIEFLARPKLLRNFINNNSNILIKNHINNLDYEQFKECKIYFDKTIDRVFLKPMSQRQIHNYFCDLICIWRFIFKNQKYLSLILYQSSPHFPWDIVSFFVAKFLKLKVAVLKRTLIDDCVILSDDFRENITKNFLSDKEIRKKIDINNLLNGSYWDQYSKNIIESRIKNNKLDLIILKKIPSIFKNFYIQFFSLKSNYYNINKIEFLKLFFLHFLKQNKLRKKYKKITHKFSSQNKKIIYFPFHFQPERSTDPEAGFYSDQINAALSLSKVVPDDYVIWIKEHPRQSPLEFPNLKRYYYRELYDFEILSNLNNVRLLDINYPTSKILNKTKFVASCTGSVLWEALVKGIPAVRFGSTWHDNCKSCYYFDEFLKNTISFDEISKIKKEKVIENVKLFLVEFEKYTIESSNADQFAKYSKLPFKDQIKNLSKAISNLVR